MIVTSADTCYRVFEQALRDKDAAGLIARFSEDAILIVEGRSRVVGREAIEQSIGALLPFVTDVDFEVIDIIENGDVALERLVCTVKMVLPSGEEQVMKSQSNVVLRKQPDGNWLTVIDDGGA
jgi:uncharacterized protein (TIGR02246 family)